MGKWAILVAVLLAGCALAEAPARESPVTESPRSVRESPEAQGTLRVVFPDVGQGGAAIIQTPDGRNILYDCGRSKDRLYDDLIALGIERIDLLITSNPDADHIGACRNVMRDLEVVRVVDNGEDKDTQTSAEYRSLTQQFEYEALQEEYADEEFPFLEYLVAYDTRGYDPSSVNENSLGMKLTWGDATFLFTGDCEADCEEELVKTADLDVDVYQAGHHGSRTSSTHGLLEEATPDVVFISVGENNYGHPHPEALDRIDDYTENIFPTIEYGTMVLETDGKTITVTDADGVVLWRKA